VSSQCERRIGETEFNALVAPLLGLPVTRPWRGGGSALMLELGVLSEERSVLNSGRVAAGGPSLRGVASVMVEWSWRVERVRSIAFGSWSTDLRMNNGIAALRGHVVEVVALAGRLPELTLRLSGGLWVQSFNTSEGQPAWTIFLPDESWLTTVGGHVVHNTQNQSSGAPSP
jgi:hypothetical protein